MSRSHRSGPTRREFLKHSGRAAAATALMAAHTGRVITYDDILNCGHEFAPDVANFTMDSPAPVQLKDGNYPYPMPGMVVDREYPT